MVHCPISSCTLAGKTIREPLNTEREGSFHLKGFLIDTDVGFTQTPLPERGHLGSSAVWRGPFESAVTFEGVHLEWTGSEERWEPWYAEGE